MTDDTFIEVGGERYLRERVTARLRLADPTDTPVAVAKASNDAVGKLYWPDQKNPDLVHVQFVLDTEGANANWDYQTRANMAASHSTAVFKPIDMEHVISEQSSMTVMNKDAPPVKNTICGVMTSTALCWAKTGAVLTDDELKKLDTSDDWRRGDDDKLAICAWGALYSFLFPKTVADVLQSIEDGEMHVSMERWIASFDFMVWDGKGYGSVSKADAESNGVMGRWKTHQSLNGKPIFRRSLASVYGGVANTTNPANSLSRFLGEDVVKSEASARTLAALGRLHDAIHARFMVAPSSEHPKLIEYHTAVTRAIAATAA